MRCIGREKFLAGLSSNTGVSGGEDAVANVNAVLSGDVRYHRLQVVFLDFSCWPRGEVSHFAVVAILREKLLGPNVEELSVVEEDSCIEANVSMSL